MLSIASCASAEDVYVTKANPRCLGAVEGGYVGYRTNEQNTHHLGLGSGGAVLPVVESGLRECHL